MKLTSNAFDDYGKIPDLYTCTGKDISPPLKWDEIPDETKSYAIIMDDIDIPIITFTHWILYNIPSKKRELQENISHKKNFSDGMIQGVNSMRKNKYMGPCPPFGKHRYVFKLYALDTKLEGDFKVNKKKLLKKMNGHILEQCNLTGIFSKK